MVLPLCCRVALGTHTHLAGRGQVLHEEDSHVIRRGVTSLNMNSLALPVFSHPLRAKNYVQGDIPGWIPSESGCTGLEMHSGYKAGPAKGLLSEEQQQYCHERKTHEDEINLGVPYG